MWLPSRDSNPDHRLQRPVFGKSYQTCLAKANSIAQTAIETTRPVVTSARGRPQDYTRTVAWLVNRWSQTPPLRFAYRTRPSIILKLILVGAGRGAIMASCVNYSPATRRKAFSAISSFINSIAFASRRSRSKVIHPRSRKSDGKVTSDSLKITMLLPYK